MTLVFVFGFCIALYAVFKADNPGSRFVAAELATTMAVGWLCLFASEHSIFLDIALGSSSVAFVGLLAASYILGGENPQ